MPPKSGKKEKPSPKKKPKPYVAPKPKKPKIWGHIVPGLAFLRYRPEMKEQKGSAMARRIKNASACIVAPVYAAVEKFHYWSTAIVENIFDIGAEVHRTTLQQLKLRANSSFPIQCVCPTFFLNYNKVTILVRTSPIPNPIQGGVSSSLADDQVKAVEKLLSDNHGVVLQCSGKTFSFWKEKNKYFGLIPEGFGGSYIPILLKAKDLKILLEHMLDQEHGVCTLFSVKVLNKAHVPMTLDNINQEFEIPEIRESMMQGVEPTEEQVAEPVPEAAAAPPPPAKQNKKEKKKVEEEPAEQVLSEDMILTYSSDYKEFPDNRGILVGKEYCKDPDRILHTVIAAAIFLHHFPANLWTSAIIRDIMKLSKKLFYISEAEELLENEDWMDRIKFPIKFVRKNFAASFEKIVFGKVCTTDPEVLSVEQGLMKFFEGNDTGLLVGPQLVLVWQQKNNYFMFDPKERDGLGRKWTRMFSAELGSTALSGSACVTWYRHPKKLAEVYVDNIALKHRKDPYRIVKIRIYESPSTLEDEGDWIGMVSNRWILVGTKTLCDYSYAEDKLRVGKAICMGVSALLHAMETPEEEWDASTIDDILGEGVEILKQSLPSEGGEHFEGGFTVASIKKIMDVGGRRLKFTIIDCMIRGPMLGEANPKAGKKLVTLKTGLSNYFDTTRYGLFTVKDIALALWRGEDNHFYIFFPYEKPFGVPPQCLCSTDQNLPPMGMANAMRFRSLNDVFSFLTSCLNTKESDEYCLNPIDIGLSDATDRPPLQEYEEFGEGGAILRPIKDLHEGHEMYGIRADKQTLANLLTALGFNRINSSTNWSREDLADILNIGDKMFCKIFLGLPECQARDYVLQWEDVVPVIGMNKFTFTRDPIEGVIEAAPELVEEEVEHEMGIQEDYENEEGVEAADDELFVRPQGSLMEEMAPTKDLRGILQMWDKKKSEHHEAIVETDFFRISIWKRDDLYFVFDPKASGETGDITERRFEIGKDHASGEAFSNAESPEGEDGASRTKAPPPLVIDKRSYADYDNEGTAYVAWFSDFEEFYDHIYQKVPQDYRSGKLILHELVLNSMAVGTDDFEVLQLRPGYRALTPNHSIIRGSMKQNNPSLTNSNKQEYSNCLVAIAFAKITPSSKMTTTLLDVILKYGDRLYSKSLNALKKADKAKYCEIEKLGLDELSPMFSIYKIRFNWKTSAMTTGNFLVNDLKKGLGKLGTIEGGSAMLLVYKGYTMAFWRSEGGLYLYDPFETNPSGALAENGLPSMSKFAKLDNMLSYLLTKFVCVPGPNSFAMYTIAVKTVPVEELRFASTEGEDDVERTKLISYIPKDQEMFHPYQTDLRILRSPLASSKLPQHSLALAALVHSRLQYVELWNYNIAQRISFLSRYILQRNDCEIENPLTPISFDDIRCSFAIDNNILCHIVFTKNMQGPIYSSKRTEIVGINFKNALTMFFKNCTHVVITMPGFGTAFALWRENGKYYLCGVDRVIPEVYVIASPTLPALYDTLLKGTNPEADVHNWYELRSVSVTTVPIKEGVCKPLKFIKKTQKGPFATKSGEYYAADSKEAHFYDHISEKPEGIMIKPQVTEFIKIDKGIEILYSRDSLKAHRFYGTKDFFPSLQAACVETSALSRVKSPSLWTKKTLEKIISAGINLYINSVAVKGTSNLQIVDFKGNLYVANVKLEVCPLTPTVQAAKKDDLLMCLTWILRKYQTAYMYTENFCFTLILENNDYYLYFPGSSEVLCTDLRNECSCLIRFCTISDLLDKLLSNGEISLCENVCIGPICVFKH